MHYPNAKFASEIGHVNEPRGEFTRPISEANFALS